MSFQSEAGDKREQRSSDEVGDGKGIEHTDTLVERNENYEGVAGVGSALPYLLREFLEGKMLEGSLMDWVYDEFVRRAAEDGGYEEEELIDILAGKMQECIAMWGQLKIFEVDEDGRVSSIVNMQGDRLDIRCLDEAEEAESGDEESYDCSDDG